MGTRKINKQVNYSHKPTQTKQQVAQCVAGTLLVHGRATGKHKFTRFTKAWIWGKPTPFPLQYSLCLATGPAPKCHFVPRLPSGSLEIPKIGTPMTLGAHNFVCKPLIEVRSKAKLQPSLRAFHLSEHKEIRAIPNFQWSEVKLPI